MATQEDRSLSSGMSLPQWMKTKMNDRSDIEQNAFSPTELDDSFMLYYRKNKKNLYEPPKQTEKSLAEKTQDFSKHTPYCQKYLQHSFDTTSSQKVVYPSPGKSTKSSGVDDGFKGEAALCGSSVVRVAHQMVVRQRGFAVMNKECGDDLPPEGFNPAMRRGSKSLPASPLSSPKSTRKINKYFTGPYGETESHGILSNLLGSRRQEVSHSVGNILEEEASAGGSMVALEEVGLNEKKPRVFVPKASELREMNFWSPTSM